MIEIDLLNQDKNQTAVFGANQFTDRTEAEKNEVRGTFIIDDSTSTSFAQVSSTSEQTPPTVAGLITADGVIDWRRTNRMTAIKNHGSCGSCWAFTAVSVYETMIAVKQNKAAV